MLTMAMMLLKTGSGVAEAMEGSATGADNGGDAERQILAVLLVLKAKLMLHVSSDVLVIIALF